jgi:hypothetical protein
MRAKDHPEPERNRPDPEAFTVEDPESGDRFGWTVDWIADDPGFYPCGWWHPWFVAGWATAWERVEELVHEL